MSWYYLFGWAVDLGVPFLAVQAHLDPLTNEQTGPHEHVPHRPLSLVIESEVEDTCSKEKKLLC